MRLKRKAVATVAISLATALVVAVTGSTTIVANAAASPAAKAPASVAKKHHKKRHAHKKKHHKKAHHKKAHKKKAHKKKTSAPQALGVGPKEKGGTKAIESASAIPVAPAFTNEQLNAQPSGNWIGSEGGTTGDHYSTLSEINTSNVANLKADWMTQLDGSGLATKFSGEAGPTEYKGVLYYETGNDDVFAVSAADGKILWVHSGNVPESTSAVVCCGWDSRGVALGDGLVYAPVLNGSVEALNQQTGKLVWKTELGEPSEGLTITSAPLYFHGMIFIGPVGSEYGVRGFMTGLNAKTGALIWKHYNIPAPGEPGHETWPTDTTCQECNASWQHGGATTWNAPTVDDKTGLIYYSTANAGADYQGATRAGEDLWTVSMLALNYKTGEQKWGYQEVHHDIWDYDASSQPTMINAEIEGKQVEGIVQADKDGYVYFVNAVTGKPVFPIEEKPVPQDTQYEATSATEPIPTMPPFLPLKASAAKLAEIQASVNTAAATLHVPAPTVDPNSGYEGQDVFAAVGIIGEPTIQVSSGGGAGDREAPQSFDQKDGIYVVCSQYNIGATSVSPELQHWEEGKTFTGVRGLRGSEKSGETIPGFVTAYDMHTGKILWMDEWPHECYSGVATTAGGVVFVGDNESHFKAYDIKTGKELWSFETGAGINAPAAIYEYGGKERVAIFAGGNHYTLDVHGDNLWQFSIGGTGPAPIADGQTPPAPETVPPPEEPEGPGYPTAG